MRRSLFFHALLAVLILSSSSVWGQLIELRGSSGLARLINSHLAEIQKCGVGFDLEGVGTGRGLLDLTQGRANGALVGGALPDVIAVLSKDQRFTGLEKMDLVENIVYQTPLHFIVNNDVPITHLTLEQARMIMMGNIQNWKEVGGPDKKIVVIVPLPTDGARMTFVPHLLNGGEIALTARWVRNSAAVAVQVGVTSGSFAITDAPVEGLPIRILTTDRPIIQIFSIVTHGVASGNMSKLIAAIHDSLRIESK